MTKIIYASEAGALLDSNVYTGGGTDDTVILQKILDEAKNGGVHLILDGAALVRGLEIHSNTTIECPNKDCGLFLANQSNDAILKNADQDMQKVRNRNIRIIGGTYNGNCLNQEHHISPPEGDVCWAPEALWPTYGMRFTFGMFFAGVEDLEMTGVTVRDCCTFAVTVGCFRHVTMENIWIDIPNHMLEQNQDGLHFWGEGQFLTLRNIRGFSGDDFIALNTDEYDGEGSITDVLIDGVVIDGATRVIRLLSRNNGRLDRVTIRNVTGNYKGYGFFIETHFPDSTSGGNVGNIVFENIDLRPSEPAFYIHTPFLFNISIKCEHLVFRNIYDHYPECQRNLFQFCYDKARATQIKKITIDGLTLLSDKNITEPPFLLNVPIENLTLRNVDIQCAAGENTPLISFGEDGHIGSLTVNSMVSKGISKIDDAPDGAIGKKILWNIDLLE